MKKEAVFTTPWFELIAKRGSEYGEPHYSISTLDYVSVLAITANDKVILVDQYRPAVEKKVLELPSGHVEKNETPEQAAVRELLEETGYASPKMSLLGSFWPDTGRMSNKVWYYLAEDATYTRPSLECAELGVVFQDLDKFIVDISTGVFEHSLNLPAVLLTVLKSSKFRKKILGIVDQSKEIKVLN